MQTDPAKAGTAALRVDNVISKELFSTRIPEGGVDYAVDLLTWITGKLTAEQLKDDDSLTTFAYLLKVALAYDEDHYHEYVAILVHYAQDPEFQQKIATPEILDDLVVLMLDFEARLSPTEIQAVFQELAITKTDVNPPQTTPPSFSSPNSSTPSPRSRQPMHLPRISPCGVPSLSASARSLATRPTTSLRRSAHA
jgi:hypothetical protein